ncbi:integrase core domain-containing protein [Saccharopolyspora sp. 5N102]|uniref:integrase core domain-containing protein n=1 Tax=Saccharopolyspora sp. 5N102 TaxID=3375155 RepID=UPI0037B696C7
MAPYMAMSASGMFRAIPSSGRHLSIWTIPGSTCSRPSENRAGLGPGAPAQDLAVLVVPLPDRNTSTLPDQHRRTPPNHVPTGGDIPGGAGPASGSKVYRIGASSVTTSTASRLGILYRTWQLARPFRQPIPPRSPNCNPHTERFIRSVHQECTNRMLISDRGHAEKIHQEYACHFNTHRPHQARDQRAPLDDPNAIPLPTARIEHRQAVAGLINEYRQAA